MVGPWLPNPMIRVRFSGPLPSFRGVAQLVEQATDNRQVRGSIPLSTTKMEVYASGQSRQAVTLSRNSGSVVRI